MTLAMRALLERKGFDVWAVSPDDTVYDAIALMAKRSVSAVLVMDGGHLVGILSERDYTRKVVLEGRSSADTPVKTIMTTPVITIGLNATLEDCMKLMSRHDVRHLPLVDKDGSVLGVISTRDVLQAMLRARGHTIFQLERYIMGI